MTSAELTRIRIAHVITGLGVGGAEMMLLKLVSRLDPARFESEVFALSEDAPLAPGFREAGCRVNVLAVPATAIGGLTAVRRLVGALRKRNAADLVQTWLYHADLAGGAAARLVGLPVIWNIQASSVDPLSVRTVRIAGACARLSHRLPAAIVSCSHAAVELHVQAGYDREKFTVIANGIDNCAFRPDSAVRAAVRAELGVGPATRVVAMVARFHPQKDHATFLAAAGVIAGRIPDVRFVLAGLGLDGDNQELARMIESSGTGERISLLGVRNDVARILCGVDLHVLSSAFGEGWPNIVGEAMAAGVPCVVTNVGDSAEIVGPAGLSVPPREPGALAEAVLRLLALPDEELQELGIRARDRIESHFTIERSVARYEALYTRMASLGARDRLAQTGKSASMTNDV